MATDLAQIGITLDTTSVETGMKVIEKSVKSVYKLGVASDSAGKKTKAFGDDFATATQKIADSAKKAETNVDKMTTSSMNASKGFDAFIKEMNKASGNLERLAAKADRASARINNIGKHANDAHIGVKTLSTSTAQTTQNLLAMALGANTASLSTRTLDGSMKLLSSTMGAFMALRATQSMVMTADSAQLMNMRIKIATESTEEFTKAKAALVDISLRTGTSLEANAISFFRNNAVIKELGGTTEHTLRITETMTKALRISGATAGETASVVRQLSQAFSKGKLNGDEFNAVTENGARIAELLRNALGVTQGELLRMAHAGEISSQRVTNAMIAQSAAIDKAYSEISSTVGSSMTNINTAFSEYLLQLDESNNFTKDLADTFNYLANNMTGIADTVISISKALAVMVTGSIIKAVYSYIKVIWLKVAGIRAETAASKQALIAANANLAVTMRQKTAQLGSVAASAAVTAAQAAQTAAVTRTNTAIAAQNTLLKLNPWGLAITAIAGLAFAYSEFNDELTNTSNLSKAATIDLINLTIAAEESKLSTAETINSITGGLISDAEIMKHVKAIQRLQEVRRDLRKEIETDVKDPLSQLSESGNNHDTETARNNADKSYATEIKNLKLATFHLLAKGDAYSLLVSRSKNYTPEQAKSILLLQKSIDSLKAEAKAKADAAKKLKSLTDATVVINKQNKIKEILLTQGVDAAERAKLIDKGYTKGMLEQADAARKLGIELDTKIEAQKQATKLEKELIAISRQISAENAHTTEMIMLEREAILAKTGSIQDQINAYSALYIAEEKDRLKSTGLSHEEQKLKLKEFKLNLDSDNLNDQLDRASRIINEWMKNSLKIELEIGGKDIGASISKALSGFDALAVSIENINNLASGKKSISSEINKTSAAIDKLDKKEKGYAKKKKKLKEREMQLSADLATNEKLQGIEKVKSYADGLAAAGAMFGGISDMMEEGSEKQKAFAILSIAVETAANIAKGIGAILNQAQGDPYTAIPRMIAMAGMVASMGVSIAGIASSGASRSQEAQDKQGRGSVFGNTDSISMSIDNSFDTLSDMTSLSLDISSLMLRQLEQIQANTSVIGISISGSQSFSRHGALAESTRQQSLKDTQYMSRGNELALSIFSGGLFSPSKSKVSDSGVDIDETDIGSLLAGELSAQYFSDIHTYKTALFGLIKYGHKTETIKSDIDSGLQEELGLIFSEVGNVILTASSSLLGASEEEIIRRFSNYSFDVERISLKGLSDEQMTKAVEAVLNKSFDELAEIINPNLIEFQQVEEGILETLVRVSSGVEMASASLSQLGINAIRYTSIINKQLEVDSEIVRQSILLVSEFDNISTIMSSAQGSASDLVATYSELLTAQNLLMGLGLGADTLSSSMIGASGGLTDLNSNLDSFFEGFYSDSERLQIQTANLSKSFFELTGQALPKSELGFRGLIESINTSTDSGKELLGRMLGFSDAFLELQDLAEEAADEISGINDVFKEMLTQNTLSNFALEITDFMASVMISYKDLVAAGGDLELASNATSKALSNKFDSFFKPFTDIIRNDSLSKTEIAISNLNDKYAEAIKSVQELGLGEDALMVLRESYIIETQKLTESALKSMLSIAGNLSNYLTKLDQGSLSTLSPTEKLHDSASDFASALSKARAGDDDAVRSLAGLSDTLLGNARDMYASGEQYSAIFDNVTASLAEFTLPDTAEEQFMSESLRLQQEIVEASLGFGLMVDSLLSINNSSLTDILSQSQVSTLGVTTVGDLISKTSGESKILLSDLVSSSGISLDTLIDTETIINSLLSTNNSSLSDILSQSQLGAIGVTTVGDLISKASDIDKALLSDLVSSAGISLDTLIDTESLISSSSSVSNKWLDKLNALTIDSTNAVNDGTAATESVGDDVGISSWATSLLESSEASSAVISGTISDMSARLTVMFESFFGRMQKDMDLAVVSSFGETYTGAPLSASETETLYSNFTDSQYGDFGSVSSANLQTYADTLSSGSDSLQTLAASQDADYKSYNLMSDVSNEDRFAGAFNKDIDLAKTKWDEYLLTDWGKTFGDYYKYEGEDISASGFEAAVGMLSNLYHYEVGSNLPMGWAGIYALSDMPKFANGGAFTNGIVSQPTMFDMGQMGEAGSEGILPLDNIGGKLGVNASGMSNNKEVVAAIQEAAKITENATRQAIQANAEGQMELKKELSDSKAEIVRLRRKMEQIEASA